ncbi:MAG: NAD(P)H-binding protein, partial [Paracoccus sp. (in: a-proteobacteria)]
MTIAISGASGQLGRLVIDHMIARRGAAGLIGLARNPEAAALPVQTRAADYDRPETLAPALAGVDTLLLISGSEIGRRTAQHRAVIEAAKAAGVRQIVYTSLLHADRSPLSLAPEHRETEAMLLASGLAVTILRNGWYQ